MRQDVETRRGRTCARRCVRPGGGGRRASDRRLLRHDAGRHRRDGGGAPRRLRGPRGGPAARGNGRGPARWEPGPILGTVRARRLGHAPGGGGRRPRSPRDDDRPLVVGVRPRRAGLTTARTSSIRSSVTTVRSAAGASYRWAFGGRAIAPPSIPPSPEATRPPRIVANVVHRTVESPCESRPPSSSCRASRYVRG